MVKGSGAGKARGGNSAPIFLINWNFHQLSIETRILKIGQYLIDLGNYNDLFKIFHFLLGLEFNFGPT